MPSKSHQSLFPLPLKKKIQKKSELNYSHFLPCTPLSFPLNIQVDYNVPLAPKEVSLWTLTIPTEEDFMSEVGFLIFGSTVTCKYAIYLTNKKSIRKLRKNQKFVDNIIIQKCPFLISTLWYMIYK